MKTFTPLHPTPIGTTQQTLAQTHFSTPFSAYQKPRFPSKNSSKKLARKNKIEKSFTSEKDFANINQAQQLLLMQALWLGKNKDVILQAFFHKNIEVITFVHWLAVPSLGVVLSFTHQNCERVEWL